MRGVRGRVCGQTSGVFNVMKVWAEPIGWLLALLIIIGGCVAMHKIKNDYEIERLRIEKGVK